MPAPIIDANLRVFPPGGHDGSVIPTVYDPTWQTYALLSPQQIAAFKAFPQDLVRYAKLKRAQKEVSELTLPGGGTIDFDHDTQVRIMMLAQAAVSGDITPPVPFATKNGTLRLTGPQLKALYKVCNNRMGNTFSVLDDLIDGINATPATVTTRAQINSAFSAVA